MTGPDADRELARLFRESRLADEAWAPGFRQILARAPGDARSARRPYLFAAVALALVAAVTLVGALLLRRPPAADLGRAIALEDWRPSTDALLRMPDQELFDSLPELPGPVPDYSAIAGAPSRQDPRPTRRPKGA